MVPQDGLSCDMSGCSAMHGVVVLRRRAPAVCCWCFGEMMPSSKCVIMFSYQVGT